MVVRSERLDVNSLFQSMKDGDYYCSTGVVLKNVRFDSATMTLMVEVEPEQNIQYSIKFVGTKKEFDTTKIPFVIQPRGDAPGRSGYIYSEDIGVMFRTVAGNTATYQMSPDDMYVRAIVTSDKLLSIIVSNAPDIETA